MRPVAAIVVMIGLMAALLVAFALSLGAAQRQFEHALIAQQQATLVAGIARDAATMDADALQRGLAAYRRSIAAERRYLPGEVADGGEVRRAAALAAMAPVLADRGQVAALVRQIAAAEAREVAQAREDLNARRRRTMVWGAGLALAAVVAVAAGTWQIARANRDLSAEVAARTAELRHIDQSRRLFFAQASHELRTPVTAIRVLAEVSGQGDPVLADIVAQAHFLGHRIDEMLALAKAAEGRPELAMTPCDLHAVLADAVAQALPFARSVGVEIAVAPCTEALTALADPRWLTQAILTVIDNGLKFSDPGGVLAIAWQATPQVIELRISDSGPGILPRALPRVFDAYYQAEAGRMRGGTGLGLALARWVVEQHRGQIHAENLSGGGCCIVMALPA